MFMSSVLTRSATETSDKSAVLKSFFNNPPVASASFEMYFLVLTNSCGDVSIVDVSETGTIENVTPLDSSISNDVDGVSK